MEQIKYKFALASLMLLFAFGPINAVASRSDIPMHSAPKELPEVVFYDEANRPVKLDKWRGKVVVLNRSKGLHATPDIYPMNFSINW